MQKIIYKLGSILLLISLVASFVAFKVQNADQEKLVERIYTQTDRPFYFPGETIWFKAIVTNAINHQPTKLSSILYVDLIDFDKISLSANLKGRDLKIKELLEN